MSHRQFYFLVEGSDDHLFMSEIVVPLLVNYQVYFYQYSQTPRNRVRLFINALERMDAPYVYIQDMDQFPCVTARKAKIIQQYSCCDRSYPSNIIIVNQEIESWYLAGIKPELYKQWRLPKCHSTEKVNKERFNQVIPRRYAVRVEFLQDILRNYSVEIACQKNQSFRYFWNRMEQIVREE